MTRTRLGTLAAMCVLSAVVYSQSTIAGRWIGQEKTSRGTDDIVLQLSVDGSTVTGTATIGGSPSQPLSDGKITGTTLTFKTPVMMNGKELSMFWDGEATDKRLTLVRTFGPGGPKLPALVLERSK